MTSTRERQRAAARARLEREMAERAAQARKRRRTQAIVGSAAALLLVVAGTIWLVSALGDDDKKQNAADGTPGYAQCAFTEVPKDGAAGQVKDVGLPPAQQQDTGTQTMTLDTNLGPVTAKIDRAKVPCTAGSFTHLASKGFFDNTKCHRLVTEGIKVLQCGDPSVTGKGWRKTDGTGGPSYRMAEENLPTDQRPAYPEGVIAMAKTQEPGSTGSQFFIVYGDSQLDPSYTVLGTITGGMDLVKQVAAAGSDNANQPGDGHPKKEIVIKKLAMSDIQG
ncbi:peptidylprolyl isomerase [Micromonospora globispora]|uniref:peptidylprolyl isomerase n=1 Tax=Micromonospora globispora TaxID=1450148 RepID=A0A317JUE4_9ACTN|nr:peptidylprolyl isomerase [Micromonospora globispora]PWU43564.1 peptidylprolyl isomerase [Micromonospora globispora]PWU58658.1 peptidylprolyl isomerase [Micromonospora globispora]RQX05095.1 peptidylprolyl isomerase [Micromonospora globispora]